MARDYYNQRVGAGTRPVLTIVEVAERIARLYESFDAQGYFQRAFGYDCVDNGFVPGSKGTTLAETMYLDTGVQAGLQVDAFLRDADDVKLFTFVEYAYDHVAKPVKSTGYHHDYSGCGWHFNLDRARFDEQTARSEWREKLNAFLRLYGEGFELSEDGEIKRLAGDGFAVLVGEGAPPAAAPTDKAKIDDAVRVFLLARSTREQRKQAVRVLADICEFHREVIKRELSSDENDLFNLANNFAIRHHNRIQKDDYDDSFLEWLFYQYLSTAHLTLKLVHACAPSSAVECEAPSDHDIPF